MKEQRDIMGMPVIVRIDDPQAAPADFEKVFTYLRGVDRRFSTYKTDSEISKINRAEIKIGEASAEMKEVFALSEKTKKETGGYFDIKRPDGKIDPSGTVKGLAIKRAADMLAAAGFKNFFVDIAGDIAFMGKGRDGAWSVGIRNPLKKGEIVKVIYPRSRGVATSGTYIRGKHIYDPHSKGPAETDILSLTVIGPDVYEADRFATACFAMGRNGLAFLENLEGFEAYAIDAKGIATFTSGFEEFTRKE